jgi:hypothetical protein
MTKEGSTNSCPSASNLQEQKALLKMENPRLLPHHIRLQPLEHRHEEEEQQDAADLA